MLNRLLFAQALIAQNAGPHALCDSVRVPSYLLRVQLEDRPGSLGSLAVALGSVGADILSLDVVERSSGYAIDDLVVDLPPGAMPDMLITAAEKLRGVYVDAIRPHTGLLEAHRELELIDHAEALDSSADWVPQVWRDMDTTLAAAPLGDHHTAIVLGRAGGPDFRPSEVARLGYLAGIVATILR